MVSISIIKMANSEAFLILYEGKIKVCSFYPQKVFNTLVCIYTNAFFISKECIALQRSLNKAVRVFHSHQVYLPPLRASSCLPPILAWRFASLVPRSGRILHSHHRHCNTNYKKDVGTGYHETCFLYFMEH